MRVAGFDGILRDDDDARAVYAETAGILRILPRAVAVPATASDVTALVRWAQSASIPLVPRGSGSGMAGGAVGEGVIVDLSRLRGLGPVNARARRVAAEPGVLRDEIDRAAATVGLRVPVDPSSGAFCSVGGMAATNAAGARSLRYGATRPWVVALDCVFDDGSRATVRRGDDPPSGVPAIARFLRDVAPAIRASRAPLTHAGVRKDSSGYGLADYARSGELVDLLVGSEGTLAVFVGVELALAPRPPATASLLAAFPALELAVDGTARARLAGAVACELLDRTFLDVVASDGPLPVPRDTDGVLLIEMEGDAASSVGDAARALARSLEHAGATRVHVGLDAASERRLWALRHAASPILARLDARLKSMQIVEDGAVPPERLGEYVRGVRRALDARGLRGVIFGHAGDGHVHVNPLVDVSAPDWRARVEGLLADVVGLTAHLGGTLAGEHGDGRLRTPWLAHVWPAPVRELFARVKVAFDPAAILNPGVKVPRGPVPLLGDVKYDASLPPTPPAARRALELVERDRAYARLRLAVLDAASGAGDPA